MHGNQCGIDKQVKDKPFLFFFDPECSYRIEPLWECSSPYICVNNCPNTTETINAFTCGRHDQLFHSYKKLMICDYAKTVKLEKCVDLEYAMNAGECEGRYTKSRASKIQKLHIIVKISENSSFDCFSYEIFSVAIIQHLVGKRCVPFGVIPKAHIEKATFEPIDTIKATRIVDDLIGVRYMKRYYFQKKIDKSNAPLD